MKVLLTVFACVAMLPALAQNEVSPLERNLVEKAVKDSTRETYYPKLLQRFEALDTTLSKQEYRLLYYGYVFQPDYNGYAVHKKKEILTALQDKNYAQMDRLCDSVLETIPISLIANYYKGLALYKLDETDIRATGYRTRYRGLRDAVLSTGDGLSCATAFRVLFIDDEYEVMYNYFEINGYKMQSLNYPCDRFDISPSQYFKASKIYFDASELFLSMEKKLKNK